MSDLPADAKGTGWRISGRSGKRWFRIEKGSREFDEWLKFYRANNRYDLAKVIQNCGYSFVAGPFPLEFGGAQIAFLNSQMEKSA